MIMRILAFTFIAVSGLFLSTPALAQQEPPYWASIDEPEARMRTGPSTEYPTMWIYKREKLPVKILARYNAWRKIEDHEGTQGWMHARLLSASRTALVLASSGEPIAMRALPNAGAKTVWLAEPGVVGSLSFCDKGWCLFDVTGRQGYVSVADVWGDEPLK
ncbi:SH3 domain-containing protein [Parasphingorhabdus sp.]|uniref:SH3 domain-containing protein n=1 Tax=Parasphingorhabdus sp. TaxID=2709688 RepID=UPI0032654829